MPNFRDQYKMDDIPCGTRGDWTIERFTIKKSSAELWNMQSLFGGSGAGRSVRPGKYTRLRRGSTLVMSDTHDEIRDHLNAIHEVQARGGHVLIHGLGLGMFTQAALRCPKVTRCTVIEISKDLIELMGPYLTEQFGRERLEIIEGDAYLHRRPKGERYTVVWHDIWDTLNTENLQEMGKLHRRYGNRCDWQDSWGKSLLTALRRRESSRSSYGLPW